MQNSQESHSQRVKERLSRIRDMERDIQEIEDEIARLRIARMNPSSHVDDIRPNRSSDLSDYTAAVDSLLHQLTARKTQKFKEYAAVLSQLEKMESAEAKVLELRYLKGQSWKEISWYMHLSESQVYRIRRKALANFKLDVDEDVINP